MKLFIRFSKNLAHLFLDDRKNFRLITELKYYFKWLKSFSDKNPLNGTPWICYSAIDYFKKVVKKDMMIFEYGSGNSTLLFASLGGEVLSVEHNEEWHSMLCAELKKRALPNVSVKLLSPVYIANYSEDPSSLTSYSSISVGGYESMSFEAYVNEIQNYPDNHFDIIFVDGRTRPACIAKSYTKIKPGGLLVLDNSERAHYDKAIKFIDGLGWPKKEFYGTIPRADNFSRTTFWTKK